MLDRRVWRADGGRTLIGGSPPRVLHLSPAAYGRLAGPDGIAPDARLTVTDATSAALARLLTDAGVAHPEPGHADAPAPGVVSVVVPVRDRPGELARLLGALAHDRAGDRRGGRRRRRLVGRGRHSPRGRRPRRAGGPPPGLARPRRRPQHRGRRGDRRARRVPRLRRRPRARLARAAPGTPRRPRRRPRRPAHRRLGSVAGRCQPGGHADVQRQEIPPLDRAPDRGSLRGATLEPGPRPPRRPGHRPLPRRLRPERRAGRPPRGAGRRVRRGHARRRGRRPRLAPRRRGLASALRTVVPRGARAPRRRRRVARAQGVLRHRRRPAGPAPPAPRAAGRPRPVDRGRHDPARRPAPVEHRRGRRRDAPGHRPPGAAGCARPGRGDTRHAVALAAVLAPWGLGGAAWQAAGALTRHWWPAAVGGRGRVPSGPPGAGRRRAWSRASPTGPGSARPATARATSSATSSPTGSTTWPTERGCGGARGGTARSRPCAPTSAGRAPTDDRRSSAPSPSGARARSPGPATARRRAPPSGRSRSTGRSRSAPRTSPATSRPTASATAVPRRPSTSTARRTSPGGAASSARSTTRSSGRTSRPPATTCATPSSASAGGSGPPSSSSSSRAPRASSSACAPGTGPCRAASPPRSARASTCASRRRARSPPATRSTSLDRPAHGITVAEVFAIVHHERDRAARLLEVPELPASYHRWARERLARR